MSLHSPNGPNNEKKCEGRRTGIFVHEEKIGEVAVSSCKTKGEEMVFQLGVRAVSDEREDFVADSSDQKPVLRYA